MKKSMLKLTAHTLIVATAYQLVFPVCAYALTSGPSQPEVQSFEPVGTTEMVNTFTGDFVYNIPLLDVEGYPVNISYHSGIGVEDEASWVGLGWNINPGEINRTVRGLPDDFNGDRIEKELNIRDEKNVRVATGGNIGVEIAGFSLGLSHGMYANFNNYKGTSVGFSGGTSFSWKNYASVGINMGIGSQTGADVDLNASVGFSSSKSVSQDAGGGVGFSISGGTGFNSRSGLKGLSFAASTYSTVTGSRTKPTKNIEGKNVTAASQSTSGITNSSTIPIGLQNYVPVVTNASHFNTFQFQVKGGGELYYTYPNLYLNAMISRLSYSRDGARSGYGYLYSEKATKEGIMDFSRDKDGIYNRTLPNLPLSSMTYDIYTISGQGTGGMFRPYRNDIGTVYDPEVKSSTDGKDVLTEFGVGNLFEFGADLNFYDNETRSGPWKVIPFGGKETNSLYENVFFKQAGELTYNNQQSTSSIFNTGPSYLQENLTALIGKGKSNAGNFSNRLGATNDRTTRANLLTYRTADAADRPDVLESAKIRSYDSNSFGNSRHFDPVVSEKSRYGTNTVSSKKHHITEFTQTLPNGKRYVYGIPVVNHASREVTFNVDEGRANLQNGLVRYTDPDNSMRNDQGREHFYSSTTTPAHATSYLLTSVLSGDYIDFLGDGPTDDDPGSYVKFNYTLINNDYRWRAPYQSDSAQYNPGFSADSRDGKGTYIVGSRQQWHLRSIESKNYIAEFYISARSDGKGTTTGVLSDSSNFSGVQGIDLKTTSSAAVSYKLDSIKLYNKHDRYINENKAIPMKTVIFDYNYDLCPGTPNSDAQGKGKLTLKRIYIKYGNSEKSLLSPYVFDYNGANPIYDFAAKDRWGTYKANSSSRSNYEFPYTSQDAVTGTDPAASYSLTDIKLPSGGKIHIEYESDDYAYVQDKRTMQMFDVAGFGSSANYEQKTDLYEDESTIYDYLYFERRKDKEVAGLSMRENYLEDQDLLYYSFNLDITGTGKYEYIKGYAKIDGVGVCPNDTTHGYVKLKRDNAGGMSLHPATIYGLNLARYYLPHVLYKGFDENDGDKKILMGLIEAAGELRSIWQNPFKRYIKEKKAQNVRLARSWVRLQVPGLTKKGGGIRVKELTLSDNWQQMTGSQPEATYGRTYDYTITDNHYGVISSGVASYEPLIGGDENPFRKPVPYTADGGRLLPATEFFQEEPYGEIFFPAPIVGYSSVKVKSIHAEEGRSSQSEDEYLFYTAKDFPTEIDFTEKDAPGAVKNNTLRRKYQQERVLQGYVLRFNDMHGKAKEVNNYVIKTDGDHAKRELITATRYHYQQDGKGKLNNVVDALVRIRGSRSNYAIQKATLGQEIDYTIDSRERYTRTYNRNVSFNLNVVIWGIYPVPIPTMFFPDKEEEQIFRTMVSTKVVQQYGILKSVEYFDHGATTITENLIFDSETGQVLLSSVNNEFNDKNYELKYPAYLAYSGMGPAYLNDGYEEVVDSITYDYQKYHAYQQGNPPPPPAGIGERKYFLYPKHREYFMIGDELLIEQPSIIPNGAPSYVKAWITDIRTVAQDNTGDPNSPACSAPPAPICRIEIGLRNTKDNGNVNELWPASSGYTKTNVKVKVLRSGRRNNLTEVTQEATLAQNPYGNSINDLFGNTTANGNAFDKLISITARTYSDSIQPFADSVGNFADTVWFYNAATTQFSDYKSGFNPFVAGTRGSFRPVASYVNLAKRSYLKTHTRYDGVYPINQLFWNFTNNNFDACGLTDNVLTQSSYNPEYWKMAGLVTRTDIFGNVYEERDAIGNYSAAQWGYNKKLPLSVASNVRQNYFFFDGFEDHAMLYPETSRTRFGHSSYYQSPFSLLFNAAVQNVSTLGYSNQNAGSGPSTITRYGQRYNLLNPSSASLSGIALTKETSHSGSHSLKCTSAQSLSMPVSNGRAEESAYYSLDLCRIFDIRAIHSFRLQRGRTYVYNCWLKPVSPGTPVNNLLSVNVNGNNVSLAAKSGNIDGWYLMEGIIDLRPFANINAPLTLSLNLPANVYIDDVRMVPIDASMKSFVYDPMTMRLVAQLDENHLASFYEYDQEGLLTRVKKETDKGIVTISENRRANSKQ